MQSVSCQFSGSGALVKMRGIQFTFETLQIAANLGGTLIAQLNIFFQGLADEALRFRRQIRIQADGSDRSTVENRFRNDPLGPSAKWQFAPSPFRRARLRRKTGRYERPVSLPRTCSGDM